MKIINFTLLGAIVLLVNSCASPRLTNNDRGKYGYIKIDDPTKILEVSISTLPLPEAPKKLQEKPKTFFDLRDSIPHAFLRVIGSKSNNTQEIIDIIKQPLSKIDISTPNPTLSATIFNNNEIKIRLVFSNIKKYYYDQRLMHPNTRLEFLTTTLKIPTPFSVVSIDRIENEFEQIDLGLLERTQNVSFNSKLSVEGNLGATSENTSSNSDTGTNELKSSDSINAYDENGKLIGTVSKSDNSGSANTKTNSSKTTASNNISGKGELQYANSEVIKEALQLKFKKIKTGFSFSPNSITISQRGMPLSDISDNIIVTATLKVNTTDTKLDNKRVTEFTKLFDAKGNPNSIDSIGRRYANVHYPPCYTATDINLTMDYSGVIRGVKNEKRGRNILEYDDKVIYYHFEKLNNLQSPIVINKSEYCHDVYKVIAKFANDEEFILKIFEANANEVLIYDDHNPKQFVEWLVKLITEKDIIKLISNTKLAFTNIDGSKIIYLSKPNFATDDLNELKKIKSIELKIRKD